MSGSDSLNPPEASRPETTDDTLPAEAPSERLSRPASYELGIVLGRGGMGEVVAAHDPKIGREVALKRMRGDDLHLVDRFLREARIQARLDHPSIVPVYELGRDEQNRPYFTMKRLAGETLHTVLETATLPRLLRALVEVCRAIESAHASGVIHRDLKPANIMLGSFGEVYVLDWGVARVSHDGSRSAHDIEAIAVADSMTEAGAILGTPGYAPPEQLRGEIVGPAADVYALGAILFEILTGTSLHPRGSVAAIASTLANPQMSPVARCARAIPPELDAACVAALDGDPDKRPTAHVLGDQIQRYLDGDRDLERRRALSVEQLAAATTAITSGRRADAMQAAGRALALDPESREAASLVSSLMLEPPTELPAALVERVRTVEREHESRDARNAAYALGTYFLFVPFLIWVGIRDVWVIAAMYGYVLIQIGVAFWAWRARRPQPLFALILNVGMMVLLSRLFGPIVIVPGLIGTFSMVSVQQSPLVDRAKLVIAIGIVSLVLPHLLEEVGILERTWEATAAGISISPTAIALTGMRAELLIIMINVGILVATTLFARAVAAQRRDAVQRLEIHAWHLRQLLPEDVPQPTFVSGPAVAIASR